MSILVTGGAGYIGSHTCVALLEAGYDVVVLDNLANSSLKSITRVQDITGKNMDFFKADLLDREAVRTVFKEKSIDSVIHFAGLKAVGESVSMPLKYYHNNVTGTLVLLEFVHEYAVRNFVFSSSACVYGDPATVPITESFPLQPTNPYGQTKVMIEQILRDLHAVNPSMSVSLLRYFNPVGAHKSGRIGEDPAGIPNNLVPYIAQVVSGKLQKLSVYGGDYSTPDGTGVRDYIHVLDLAAGHVIALEKLTGNPGVFTYNLGTGKGYSVLEMVRAFSEAAGKNIPYIMTGRRPGDIACCYADPSKAEKELGWRATRGIDEMCEDTWRWQSMNPNGYDE